jgi:UDP-glucose 4-epimerase
LISKKVLITGSNGFIGTYLHKAIPHADGLDLSPSLTTNVIGDIASSTFDINKYDIVYHLAALVGTEASTRTPIETYRTNVCGTINLLHDFKGLFIFLSTAGVYEPLKNPYYLSKYVCEEIIRTAPCTHLIFRLANPYGKGSKSVIQKWLSSDRIQIFGDGNQTRDFVYIDDAIQTLINPFKLELNKTYNVGTGVPTTLNELANLIVELVGNRKIEHLPSRPFEIIEPVIEPDIRCKTTLKEGLLKCAEIKST